MTVSVSATVYFNVDAETAPIDIEVNDFDMDTWGEYGDPAIDPATLDWDNVDSVMCIECDTEYAPGDPQYEQAKRAWQARHPATA